MEFVTNPNLPKKAAAVIVSPHTPKDVLEDLHSLNINTFFSPELNIPVAPIAAHPDIGILHINTNNFICAPETFEYYSKLFSAYKINIICGKTNISGNYPKDVAYNIARIFNHTFLNLKYADETVLSNLKGHMINIKQGYAKCSICIVNENSIITEDNGIAAAALDNNIDVLKISKGQVELRGFDYGFIGGSCGKLAENVLAFAGDISKHSDYNEITKFCAKKGVDVISLGKGRITDIGSILPIFEKE